MTPTLAQKLTAFAGVIVGFCAIGFAVYCGIVGIKDLAGDSTIYIVARAPVGISNAASTSASMGWRTVHAI